MFARCRKRREKSPNDSAAHGQEMRRPNDASHPDFPHNSFASLRSCQCLAAADALVATVAATATATSTAGDSAKGALAAATFSAAAPSAPNESASTHRFSLG